MNIHQPHRQEGQETQNWFTAFANSASRGAGRASTFALAVVVIVFGPWQVRSLAFSDTWQLIINTGTTIVTFLMVFLIQNSQNRDSAAIRTGQVRNSFVGIEHLSDEEIERLRKRTEAKAARQSGDQAVR